MLAKDLFIVKPSIVLLDNVTTKPFYEKNVVHKTHTVTFEKRPDDISIAVRKGNRNIFIDVFNDRSYSTFIGVYLPNL